MEVAINDSSDIIRYFKDPVKKYDKTEIRRIRESCGISQSMFANCMGVSKKTIEAWEYGKNTPTGPACRLLYILENKRLDLPFIKMVKGEV